MTQQFLRSWQLLVGSYFNEPSGQLDSMGQPLTTTSPSVTAPQQGSGSTPALDLSQLRIRFSVKHAVGETPHSAEIRVYNLSQDTANKFLGGQFGRVRLAAGYGGNLGVIFDGQIKQTITGKESGGSSFVDSYLDIFASDGIYAYTYSLVNQSLAAGYTDQDYYNAVTSNMAALGVTGGATPNFLGTIANPRGRACYGMSRTHLRRLADSNDATWTIQDGQVSMVPLSSYTPGLAVVLTAASGLIDQPRHTQEGIIIRSLLNPNLKQGSVVQIDNKSIVEQPFPLSVGGAAVAAQRPSLDADGYYKIVFVDHRGDTRGNDWYSDLTTQGVSGSASLERSVIQAGVGP